jgi:hypothetical protein
MARPYSSIRVGWMLIDPTSLDTKRRKMTAGGGNYTT